MKSLFRKKQTPFVYNKYYTAVQHKWTQKMSSLTQGLSKRKLLLLLVFFTALSAGYFLYNIYDSFTHGCPASLTKADTASKIKKIR
jgi:zona occludens toxin (predicted ATPase)